MITKGQHDVPQPRCLSTDGALPSAFQVSGMARTTPPLAGELTVPVYGALRPSLSRGAHCGHGSGRVGCRCRGERGIIPLSCHPWAAWEKGQALGNVGTLVTEASVALHSVQDTFISGFLADRPPS